VRFSGVEEEEENGLCELSHAEAGVFTPLNAANVDKIPTPRLVRRRRDNTCLVDDDDDKNTIAKNLQKLYHKVKFETLRRGKVTHIHVHAPLSIQ
jgi:hypothetical protein